MFAEKVERRIILNKENLSLDINKYKMIKQQKEFRDIISITWNFSSVCNYSCDYCNPIWKDGKYGFPSYDNVLKFINKIKNFWPY